MEPVLYPSNEPYFPVTIEKIEELFIEHKWKIFYALIPIIYSIPENKSITTGLKRSDKLYEYYCDNMLNKTTQKDEKIITWKKSNIKKCSISVYTALFKKVVEMIDRKIKEYYNNKTDYKFMNTENSIIYAAMQDNFYDEKLKDEYVIMISPLLYKVISNNPRPAALIEFINNEEIEKKRKTDEKKLKNEEKN